MKLGKSAQLIAFVSSHFATVNHLKIGTRSEKVSPENGISETLPSFATTKSTKIKYKRQIIYLKFKLRSIRPKIILFLKYVQCSGLNDRL